MLALGHRGKSSWSFPRNARGGREIQGTRLLQTGVISAERAVLGTVALFLEGEGVWEKGSACAKAWGGNMLQRGHGDLGMTFHCGWDSCLGLGWEILRKVREEVSVTGCGLLGFVNSKGLGPDPKGRVEPPKDFKQGRQDSECMLETSCGQDGSPGVALGKGRSGLRLAERGA